ncbi:MAG: hypothetical protein GXO30_07390 [Epsilonproteobacteria bacterium]|nr:hypothetical protein [Campylobacterota bacterium]
MRNINPLHLVILASVFVIFIAFQLSRVDNEIVTAQKRYKDVELIASDLGALKKTYNRPKKTKQEIATLYFYSLNE